MKTLAHFLKIIDTQTIVITLLAVFTTYLCRRYDFIVDLPTNLIGIAVIFPIVFSINSAYRRREEALKSFASFKAHATALYYAHRDWPQDGGDHQARARDLVQSLLDAVAAHFAANGQDSPATRRRVFAAFSAVSHSHEQLRRAAVPANEVSRANQYLRHLILDFERMNNIAGYRTPVTLRAHSSLFLNTFPILFGPYFASIAYAQHPGVGYVMAIVYSLVLVSLDNIQDHLENPYDGVGADDLRLDVGAEYAGLLE